MNLQAVIDRLRAECQIPVSIELLTDISEIAEVDIDLPAVRVFWGGDKVEANVGMGALFHQERARGVAVLIIGRAPTSDEDQVELVRAEIMAALCGWGLAAEPIPIQLEFAGGQPDSIAAGIVRWRDLFQYTDQLRYMR